MTRHWDVVHAIVYRLHNSIRHFSHPSNYWICIMDSLEFVDIHFVFYISTFRSTNQLQSNSLNTIVISLLSTLMAILSMNRILIINRLRNEIGTMVNVVVFGSFTNVSTVYAAIRIHSDTNNDDEKEEVIMSLTSNSLSSFRIIYFNFSIKIIFCK